MISPMQPKTVLLLRHLIIALSLSAIVFCLVFFLPGRYGYDGLSDAFFVTGAMMVGAAGLLAVGRAGIFDVLAYGMKRLVEQFTKKDDPEYKTAGDYSLAKQKKRKSLKFPYYIYLGLGAIFLIFGIVFLLLWNNSIH